MGDEVWRDILGRAWEIGLGRDYKVLLGEFFSSLTLENGI